MRGFLKVMGGVIAAASGSAFAQSPVPQASYVEYPANRDLIADLDAGELGKAVEKIDVIETASGRPKLVDTAIAFVQRMKGCKVNKRRTEPFLPGGKYHFENTLWKCPDGPATVLFAAHTDNSFITIGEYADAARMKYDAEHPIIMVAPPAPPPRRPQPSGGPQ